MPDQLFITETIAGQSVPVPNLSMGEPDGWVIGLPDLSKTMCVKKCPDTGLDFGEGITTGLFNWINDPITVRR